MVKSGLWVGRRPRLAGAGETAFQSFRASRSIPALRLRSGQSGSRCAAAGFGTRERVPFRGLGFGGDGRERSRLRAMPTSQIRDMGHPADVQSVEGNATAEALACLRSESKSNGKSNGEMRGSLHCGGKVRRLRSG
jgi:hypothetical protein